MSSSKQRFFLECVDGFYNMNCSAKCGSCLSGVCNKLSGACDKGCQHNFYAPMCQGTDFTCNNVLSCFTAYIYLQVPMLHMFLFVCLYVLILKIIIKYITMSKTCSP